MSVPRGYGMNGQAIYTNVAKLIDCNFTFTVDASNANGLGVSALKSNGFVRNVFMHTSQTPGSNDGYLNPNPAVGFALIQFKNNFNKYLNSFARILSPKTGSVKIDNAALTVGQAYVISTLGNATAAQWITIGVPAGVTPAVGVSFVAIATGAGTGNTSTSRVGTPSVSGIVSVEVVGDPNLSIANPNIAQNGGAWVLVQFLGATDASTTTLIPKAPADASVVGMTFRFDGSSVTVDGL